MVGTTASNSKHVVRSLHKIKPKKNHKRVPIIRWQKKAEGRAYRRQCTVLLMLMRDEEIVNAI